MALALSALLIVAFGIGGRTTHYRHPLGGQPDIARMAYTYLAIMIQASPLQLLLSVHADAWRNEGRAGLMALLSVGVTLANIVLNYLLIVRLDMGVAGSAWGTAIAQVVGQAFTGRIVAVAKVGPNRQVSLQLDAPIDTIMFQSLSNMRRHIRGIVGPDGRSPRKTSQGVPHLVIDIPSG